MRKGDGLFRCVMFPRGIERGVLAREAIFRLGELGGSGTYAVSVASSQLCGDEVARHGYGCRTAQNANEQMIANGRPINPTTTCRYIGHYEFSYENLLGIFLESYTVSASHSPLPNLQEHYQIELRPNGKGLGKKQRMQDRTDFISTLSSALVGPSRRICECDEAFRADLEAIFLPPLGDTADAPAALDESPDVAVVAVKR